MSEAQDLVLQLRAMGMSNRAIGREIDRNDRLIKFVADGDKPGNNLVSALRGVVAKKGGDSTPVPAAPRRTDSKGRTAKVRRKTFYAGKRTVRVKRGAVKAGAKTIVARLADAAAAGARVAFTLTFDGKARLSMSDGTSIPSGGKEQTVDIGNDRQGWPAAHIQGEAGADLVGWLVQHLIDANRLDAPYMPLAIEMRVWDEE